MKYLTSTLLLFFLWCFSINSFAQVCHPDDLLSLQRLRDNTNGGGGAGSWNTVTNLPSGLTSRWVGTNIFDWHGVDTMHDATFPTYYRVRKIDLNGNNFAGAQRLENNLPDLLFVGDAFEHVDTLILSNNSLLGIYGNIKTTAPPNNHQLKHLDLSNNDFAAGITDMFSYLLANFGSLEDVYLNSVLNGTSSSFNSYSFPTLFSLRNLHLNNNAFTDTLNLLDLANGYFEGMTTLSLSLNNITAVDILSSAANSNLQKIYLTYNDVINFQDIANALEFLPALNYFEGLSCMNENLAAPILTNGTAFPPIIKLDLSNNGLTGGLPVTFLEDIPTLEILDLHNNNLGGALPQPQFTFPSGPFAGIKAYEGTANLKTIHLYLNNFRGTINLDWFLLRQFDANIVNNGLNIPLQRFNVSGNDFKEVLPHLSQTHIASILNAFPDRFTGLLSLGFQDNALDFKDLFRVKKFFRLKQINILLKDHYVPQTSNNPNDFLYAPQDSVGIGGVKRRNAGDSVIIEAGRPVVEQEQGGPIHVLKNRYSWERVDGVGVFNNIGTVLPGGGFTGPGGPGYQPANGLLGDSLHNHKLGIKNLNPLFHHEQRFTACVENDSFPNLMICMKQKRIQVGPCVDDSGQPVLCQTMIVQFHPDTLAQYTPAEQDSIKSASAEKSGATPIARCVCGDLELWEISDTASTMTEGSGKGTKESSYKASAKPELLSADPDYPLMDSSSNTNLSDTVALPPGSGNTNSTTLVAIIDSGIDYDYPSLVSYISEGPSLNTSCMQDAVWGYNFLDSTNNATDDHGHGTAIAGIVTGLSQQNMLPDTGSIAGSIGILPLKYTDKYGEGTVFNAACAMHYAADYARTTSGGQTARVRVMNNSWGFYGDPSTVLENTVKYASENCGILVIASAGNDGIQIHGADSVRHWPSNSIFDPLDTIAANNILGVGAINNHHGDNLASYSNYSPVHVDIVAQGSDNTTQAGSSNGFVPVNGTSFATAQVARAAALLFDKYPDATYWAVKYALMASVDKLQSSDSLKIKSGGRLNYLRADSILSTMTDRTICSDYNFLDVSQVQLIENNILVYPNPIGDYLMVEILNNNQNPLLALSIINIQGQELIYEAFDSNALQYQLSTQNLPTGIYFLRLQFEGKQITKKLIKY